MSIELKIKQVSLADEARYIRKQERKVLGFRKNADKAATEANSTGSQSEYRKYAADHGWKYLALRLHRKGIVASEARIANVARAFIKGKPYAYAESETFCAFNWPSLTRVATATLKYKPSDSYMYKIIGSNAFSKKELADQILVIADWIAEHPKLDEETKTTIKNDSKAYCSYLCLINFCPA